MGVLLRVKGERLDDRAEDPDEQNDVAVRIENGQGQPEGGWQRVWHDQSMRGVTHSPSGFSWGYSGSGPSQLAYGILSIPLGPDRARENGLYHLFKEDTVARVGAQDVSFEFVVDLERWLLSVDRGEHPDDRRRHIVYVRGF